jgi:hypothetical protein
MVLYGRTSLDGNTRKRFCRALVPRVLSGKEKKKMNNNIKLTIEEMQRIAKKRGGKCLSTKYINTKTPLKWQCSKGHRWFAAPGNVKQNESWCGICAYKQLGDNQRLTIEYAQKMATRKKGKCLSKKYVGGQEKLCWQCSEGHEWKAPLVTINQGSWCPKCGYASSSLKRMYTLVEIKKIARKKGGLCLSEEYAGILGKLLWECREGHRWKSTLSAVINANVWCPICHQTESKKESIIRQYFNTLFGTEFTKQHPVWLKIEGVGRPLELDGYNEELKLAFEYNGEQHYMTNSRFNSLGALVRQRKYDEIKRRRCRKVGIKLLVIPYTVAISHLKNYILKWCDKYGISVPFRNKNIDYQNFPIYKKSKMKLIQQTARKRGGRCLSKVYVGALEDMKWQCRKKHIWSAEWNSIRRGSWCPYCAGSVVTMRDIHRLAKKHNGKCLSKRYINNRIKMKWKCGLKHIWRATSNSVTSGQWCPICGRARANGKMRKYSIAFANNLAKKHGGRCTSKTYESMVKHLSWRCKLNHVWKATLQTILRGHWCPQCQRA